MSYCFVSPDFISRPFCSHVAMLQDGASLGAYFVNKLALPLVDFKMNVIKWRGTGGREPGRIGAGGGREAGGDGAGCGGHVRAGGGRRMTDIKFFNDFLVPF